MGRGNGTGLEHQQYFKTEQYEKWPDVSRRARKGFWQWGEGETSSMLSQPPVIMARLPFVQEEQWVAQGGQVGAIQLLPMASPLTSSLVCISLLFLLCFSEEGSEESMQNFISVLIVVAAFGNALSSHIFPFEPLLLLIGRCFSFLLQLPPAPAFPPFSSPTSTPP